MVFYKKLGNVVLAFMLAYAWTWTSFMKDRGWINDDRREEVLISLTVLFLIQQIWLVFPKPASRGAVSARKPVADSYLERCLNVYYETFLGPGQDRPVVRINVMLPTRRFLIRQALYIYYFACPPKVNYTDDETACPWRKNKGTCGYAWAHAQRVIFDSQSEKLKAPASRLTKQQQRAAGHIKSVLSVPIWDRERVVGILNMDSESNVDETRFDDDAVCRMAEATARCLSAQCFADGVKRS